MHPPITLTPQLSSSKTDINHDFLKRKVQTNCAVILSLIMVETLLVLHYRNDLTLTAMMRMYV